MRLSSDHDSGAPGTKQEICTAVSLTGLELRDDCRYVVVLFLRGEAPNPIHDCGEQSLARQFPMLPQRLNQKPLTKFFSSIVTGFRDAIRVECKHVAGKELLLPHGAIPFLEESQQRAGRLKLLNVSVSSQQKARQMSAIGVAQSPCRVVVIGKQKRCISTVAGVVIEQAVH